MPGWTQEKLKFGFNRPEDLAARLTFVYTCNMKHLEHLIQSEVVGECRLIAAGASLRFVGLTVPDLDLIHAIPNGGLRTKLEAVRLKNEGVLPGVPDLFLPVARNGYHGLYLEFKKPGGVLSPDQLKIIPRLQAQGYRVGVWYSANNALAEIMEYMGVDWIRGHVQIARNN